MRDVTAAPPMQNTREGLADAKSFENDAQDDVAAGRRFNIEAVIASVIRSNTSVSCDAPPIGG